MGLLLATAKEFTSLKPLASRSAMHCEQDSLALHDGGSVTPALAWLPDTVWPAKNGLQSTVTMSAAFARDGKPTAPSANRIASFSMVSFPSLSGTESLAFGRPEINGDPQPAEGHALLDLMALRNFFHWLAGRPGYRSRLSYSDADYFNLSEKETRIAKAHRDQRVPTIAQETKDRRSTRPLGAPANELLKALENSGEFVFGGSDRLKKQIGAIFDSAGLHDAR